MSMTQRVRAALDRQGICAAISGRGGYRVEAGLGDSAIVRWWHDDLFQDEPALPEVLGVSGLAWCGCALTHEGFHVVTTELDDTGGLYIVVIECPQQR